MLYLLPPLVPACALRLGFLHAPSQTIPTRLFRPRRTIPGAKERTCPPRLRRPRRFIPGTTERHHRSQEHTPQTHLVARPVANQPPRLSRPRRTIPGAKERTCPPRLRRPRRFIPGTTESHHRIRNTHPSHYPIMPKNAE